jgi:3',5'-cyclic AMP phosphodiesterase CpdA
MLRLAHFSDVHLTSKKLGWRKRDFFSKKVTGWVNIRFLRRGARFKHAPDIVEVLMRNFRERNFDHLIFSGDSTHLAFKNEFAVAAQKLHVGDPTLPPVIGVPGNHDYYTMESHEKLLFEKPFAPWLAGERIGEHLYPFAKKVGGVWLIAVNSSTANRRLWDASGAIGPEQLFRLVQLCERLDSGPRIVVTHYPLRAKTGRVERRTHRLRDHVDALETAKQCKVSLWLHGHIHRGFVLPPTESIPFPVICAGSCTQTRRWMYNEYEIAEGQLKMLRRVFNQESEQFEDAERFELVLP